jgi:serine/threonine protein kinase/WD40 repeat protein
MRDQIAKGHFATPSEGLYASPPEVPDHQLIRRIGKGSYGEVWLALNAINKWTAVKVVHRRAEDDNRAYEQEFRGLRRYDDLSGSDGSLMPIKNVGESSQAGYFYYAMELADDATTRQPLPRPPTQMKDPIDLVQLANNYRPWTLSEELKKERRLSAETCIEHGLALAKSLHVLHEGGLVHRDVKPSNIIFVNGRPKLADVGLVAATDATMNSFAGTSGFVPLHGAGERTGDIFALGKVLYMAATGNAVSDFPRSISDSDKLNGEERQHLAELQAVYERACDPDPRDRQPSAQVLGDELEMLRRNESVLRLRQLEEERELFEKQRQVRQQRRKRMLTVSLTVAAVGIMLVSGLVMYTWRLRTAHEITVAELETSKFSRILTREQGWSVRAWQNVEKAAKQKLDDSVIRQAVSTLAGLDARIIAEFPGLRASSAAFGGNGQVLLAGFGTNHAVLVSNTTTRLQLPVVVDGQACWSPAKEPLILQQGSNACVLLEAQTGKARTKFLLEPGEAVAVGNTPAMTVTPDGSLVAAALMRSDRARIVIWDGRDGSTLGEADRKGRALGFSPDGSWLAAGDEKGWTSLWSTRPFALRAELPPGERPNPINCLAFGRDHVVPRYGPSETNRWLLAAGDSGAGIVIWNLTKMLPRAFPSGSDYNVQSLAFSPDGGTLVSAGHNNVRIWDSSSGTQLLEIPGVTGSEVLALAFDSGGNRLIVGATETPESGAVLVEFEQNRGIHRLRGIKSQVRKVWFSPKSDSVAALADDWSLAVWDIGTGKLCQLFEAAGVLADNAGGAFDATGTRFAFAAGTEAVLYDLKSGGTLGTWKLPDGFGEELRFDTEGRLFLVRRQRTGPSPNNWGWILFELQPGRDAAIVHEQSDSSYRTISMALPAPASIFLAITKDLKSKQNSVRAFDVLSGKQLWQVDQNRDVSWETLQLSACGKWCGFCMRSQTNTQLARVADGTLDFSLHEKCLAIGPAGNEYVAPGWAADHWILKARKRSKMPIHFGFDGRDVGDSFTFSANGQYIGWGATDGTVLVAEIAAVRDRLARLGK